MEGIRRKAKMFKNVNYFILALAIIATLLFIQIGVGQQPLDKDSRPKSDLTSEVQKLMDLEQRLPTTSQNVQERFRMLAQIVSLALRSGKSVKEVLSKEEGEGIESMIKGGNLDEAAKKVHNSIMKLGSFSNQDSPPLRGEFKGKMGSDPESSGFDREERLSGEATPQGSIPLMKLDIHRMANGNALSNILKLMNPAIDAKNRRLYICGTKSRFLGVVDIDSDELIDTFDIGLGCGFLIADPENENLYSIEIGRNTVSRIDLAQKRVYENVTLPPSMSIPKRGENHRGSTKTYKGLSYTEPGYPFEAGYLQDENASYGVIEITDAQGRQVGKIKHGPDALYFDIDTKTGKLYATNTGDGSISVFDLNNNYRKIKDIDVGTSVDEILLNPKTGGLYIRNRLGGSTIYYYDPVTKIFETIPNENSAGNQGIGMWPTKIIYDEDKLYVLSHYGGKVDVINTHTNKVIEKIHLDLSYKPRTDGISTMVMDKKRKILYAAFPELGEIAIADAKNLKPIKTVKIDHYDTKQIGPGRIVLSVNEKSDKFFAYLSEEKRLSVYDNSTYLLEKNMAIDIGRAERLLTSNPDKGVLYAGNRILDAKTLEEKGRFSKGDKVIAFDNAKNKIYLTGKTVAGPGKMIEKVYEFEGEALRKEWTLSPVFSVPSSFAFDFANNRFYAGYFESAIVEAFDLTVGSEPSFEPAGLSLYEKGEQGQMSTGRGNQGQTKGGAKGRCGDGICQSIEQERGVCPEDCK